MMERWAKAKIAEVDTNFGPDFNPAKSDGGTGFDAKFQKPTTGAGRYKQFKIDFATPHPGIQSNGDNKYYITQQLAEEKRRAPLLKRTKEAAEAAGVLGKGSNSRTYMKSVP